MNDFITLGRSGLIVSPFCLGTMTFGNYRWGSSDAESRRIFDRYVEDGGNFVDVADVYSDGKSEEVLGHFIADSNLRDKMVVATKFTFNPQEGNPNAGGNGRKNIYRALEGSLRRLNTDYVDLYWMHVWDTITPVEEVVHTLSTLVRSGKIRYYAFSDVPAWYAARAVTLAEERGLEPPNRIAARVFADRAHHRARARACRTGAGAGHLSLEPAGQRLPRRQVHARGRFQQQRQSPACAGRLRQSRLSEIHRAQL